MDHKIQVQSINSCDEKKRVREIIAQAAEDMGVSIENGVVSSEHTHVFVNVPPHLKISEFVQKAKGRSSKKIQARED